MRRAGQCCDECTAAKGSCLYEGAVRYSGDMWNSTGCEFCTCNRGQVVCQRAECGRVECQQVSTVTSSLEAVVVSFVVPDVSWGHNCPQRLGGDLVEPSWTFAKT